LSEPEFSEFWELFNPSTMEVRMNRLKRVLLTAGILLAMAFTFSCSSGDEESGTPLGDDEKSSPSGNSSSSFNNNSNLNPSSSLGLDISSSSSINAGTSSSSSLLSSSSLSSSYGNTNIEGYRTVVIGTQTWMAENLNYEVAGSACYDNDPTYCAIYGRLYDWATAMDLPANCNSETCASQISEKHRGICPSGWHLPSTEDWDILVKYVQTDNGITTSGIYASMTSKYLKATSGWNWNDYNGQSGNGEDKYGFAALPGGDVDYGGSFEDAGNFGFWWNASESEKNSNYALNMRMEYNNERVRKDSKDKSYLSSVRCLQD
jgi:uncharacterized protein (TIGR02145 family)